MKSIRRIKENEHAVSPIVATLVLIVVAVVGAVAVGTIMGTFSSDVAKQNNAGDVGDASKTEILVAGSSSMKPIIALSAKDYMDKHPGVKVTVQAGGSGAGLSGVVNKVLDVGMMSEALTSTQTKAYPTVKSYQVGASGVVLIAKTGSTITGPINWADVKDAYNNGNPNTLHTNCNKLVTRSDKSGTADTFAAAFGITNIYNTSVNVVGKDGNSNMVAEVKKDTATVGFTDIDYANTDDGLKVLTVAGFTGSGSGDKPYTREDVKAAYLKESGAKFPNNCTRGFYLVTNGEPNTVVKNFITYIQSPEQKDNFKNNQVVHISEIVTA